MELLNHNCVCVSHENANNNFCFLNMKLSGVCHYTNVYYKILPFSKITKNVFLQIYAMDYVFARNKLSIVATIFHVLFMRFVRHLHIKLQVNIHNLNEKV